MDDSVVAFRGRQKANRVAFRGRQKANRQAWIVRLGGHYHVRVCVCLQSLLKSRLVTLLAVVAYTDDFPFLSSSILPCVLFLCV